MDRRNEGEGLSVTPPSRALAKPHGGGWGGLRRRRIGPRLFSWLLVSLCILSIFLIVPLARTIQEFVASRWSRSLFGYSVILIVGGTFLALVYTLIFRLKIQSVTNYFWLFLVTALYIYSTLKLWDAPEEAIHFLEYGLLGFLLFRAFTSSLSLSDAWSGFSMRSCSGLFPSVFGIAGTSDSTPSPAASSRSAFGGESNPKGSPRE